MKTSHYSSCHFFHRSWRAFWGIAVLVVGISANAEAGYTTGNLLTDPGFESNALINYLNVLTPPYTTNAWGVENSVIVGAENGITPAGGTKMLGMNNAGAVVTQAWQLIDVSLYSTDIDANDVTADFTSLFNVPTSVAAALSAVDLEFYNSSHVAIGTNYSASKTLDALTATWEPLSLTNIAVPANTRFVLSQVMYNNVSIGTNRGYVDNTLLTLTVPEPSSIMLIAVGFFLLATRQFQSRKRVRILG